jgi:hypothetical protein
MARQEREFENGFGRTIVPTDFNIRFDLRDFVFSTLEFILLSHVTPNFLLITDQVTREPKAEHVGPLVFYQSYRTKSVHLGRLDLGHVTGGWTEKVKTLTLPKNLNSLCYHQPVISSELAS